MARDGGEHATRRGRLLRRPGDPRCGWRARPTTSCGSAVQDGKRWTEVETADGVVSLDLGQVVFMKLESADHKVGFSGL